MYLEKGICVEFGTKLSLVIFSCDSSIANVVSLCFKKFKIEGNTETHFCLVLKEPLCWIEEFQDIRDGDRILPSRNVLRSNHFPIESSFRTTI